ncbi:MAG: zinc-dependent alcohol dehydrogenase [Promethearchaeota archaeon]
MSDFQVLIKVKAVGICGTDLAIIKGYLPVNPPIIFGHEFAGEVVKVGKSVDRSWKNKRLTSEINTNIDFTCFYCQKKLYAQCISRKAIGIDVDGALAEYIAVEDYLLYEIPDCLTLEEATFIDPLAAAYQTFEMMPLDPSDKIMAIFGLGKLGLHVLQVAKSKGLEIIAVDGSEKKLELAKKFKADYCINRHEEKSLPRKIKEITHGLGADIVVDATGNPNALNDIIASCRTCGKIHIKSTHGLATPINITDIIVRELTLYSSRCGPFNKAIEGLNSGTINVKELISAIFDLEGFNQAITSLEKSRDHVKTIIKI